MKDLKSLEKNLGLKFQNPGFLEKALIHRSYLNENRRPELRSNERLEYLGDAVLELIISEWLFESFPDHPEGVLTNLRSMLVRTSSLAQIARCLDLGSFLHLSRGEIEGGGTQNPSLLANTIEAVIGAIYLDQGLASARRFIKHHFASLFEKISRPGEYKDPKSLLQERLQAQAKTAPVYRLLRESGPDHDKKFTVGAYLQEKLLARGTGKSLKSAEEAAASSALKNMNHSGKITSSRKTD